MRMAGARYAAGMAGAAMVALAGCSSGAPPAPPGGTGAAATAPATSVATTPAATGSATTTDPGVPAAATAQTPEGAVAFTSYFFTLVNQAWTKPQAGLMHSSLHARVSARVRTWRTTPREYVDAQGAIRPHAR